MSIERCIPMTNDAMLHQSSKRVDLCFASILEGYFLRNSILNWLSCLLLVSVNPYSCSAEVDPA